MILQATRLALCAILVSCIFGCGKEEDVPYGGEVKTATGADGKPAIPSGKPMGGANQPSLD
jgi:hypothetical protein